MLIATTSMFKVKILKSLLGDEFEMKDLGGVKKILGLVSTPYDKGSGIGSSVTENIYSDYADNLDKRRYLTGCVFTLLRFAINWKVTLQSTITLPTMEAEYMAAVETVKEAIWLKGLVSDLDLQQDETVVFCDSQSAIHLTKNQMYYEMTKYIDVRYHFLQVVVTT
jgi:hypothetical protein